ncbi:hypothetical protein JCM19000A_13950 [Silvimonas sp. JCM 19000]
MALVWAGHVFYRPLQRSRWVGALVALAFNAAVIALLLSIRQRAPLAQSAHDVLVRLLPADRPAPAQPLSKALAPAPLVPPHPTTHARRALHALIAPQSAAHVAPDAAPDVVGAVPAAEPVAPVLNIDALRDSVRKTLRRADASAPTLPDLSLPKPAQPSALAREMAKAQRASCGSAHSDMGLLAPLAIAKDLVTGTGCTLQP